MKCVGLNSPMKRLLFSTVFVTFSTSLYANTEFETPEAALSSLEAAYKANDLNAAILCKSFEKEAEEMLYARFDKKVITKNVIKETAELLELTYRKSIIDNGFPDFSDIKCEATSEIQPNGNAILTEKCLFSDGGYSVQKIKAYKVDGNWKVGEAIEQSR